MKIRVREIAAVAFVLVVGCNNNHVVSGATGDGSLIATPDHLDYGRVREQTEQSQVVVLKNLGNGPVHVTGLEIQPANAPWTINATLPTASSPWVVDAGSYHPVDMHFLPAAQGDASANLVVHSDDADAPTITVPLTGHGFHSQTDSYSQAASIGGKADILFVVDDSGSMSDKQVKLGNSFSTFINWLITKSVDYHIAVTTTDMDNPVESGHFRGNPKIIDSTTPDVVNAFKANVNVGDTGSGTERGFAGALAAVSNPLASGDNAGFLRDDARLFVVFVSDEDDQSTPSVQDTINGIAAVKGGDVSKTFFAAIAGPVPYGCFTLDASADAGPRYKDITTQTSGLFGSICDHDFGTTLQNLAFQVTAIPGTFVLTGQPDVSTIEVFVNGAQSPDTQWDYDPASNSISFLPGYIPAGGVPVTIVYDLL